MSKRKSRAIDRRGGQRVGGEWLTVYCDLMTNLMLFFLMLFALTRLPSQDKSKVFNSMKKNFTTITQKVKFKQLLTIEKETKDKISEIISGDDELGKMTKINISEKYISIKLQSPVLFASGRAKLKEKGRKVLNQIAAVLKPLSEEIIVEGHTDNTPVLTKAEYETNWELSARRSLSAIKYLEKKGISSKRLASVAYGPYRPVYPNDTEEHRAKNRRIEIKVLRER